ncbi:hypothetical protein [Tepidicella baoligensis]|uniref:hypothetical protein n=1 Tax=Tepidicella baoligensis TaxID=2707016 RepID=UPI0015DA733B|nr:hypothetical protein [Tepidicella baoligensis]
MLLFVTATKLIAEIALLALLGRWVLSVWLRRVAPNAGQGNPFGWLLDTLARPFIVMASWITPRWVPREHWPVVAFCLLLLVWLVALFGKIGLCLEAGMELCR